LSLESGELLIEFPFSQEYLKLFGAVSRGVGEKPAKTPEAILMHLRRNPNLTLAEVAESLGKSSRAVERAAARLRKQGRLCYRGPKKGGQWEVLS
jgi:predicted HTH transcriptional regulator